MNETMKETGQQTAAGYAKSNAPIPSNTHQPFPSSPVPGGIPSLDSAKIAPTSQDSRRTVSRGSALSPATV